MESFILEHEESLTSLFIDIDFDTFNADAEIFDSEISIVKDKETDKPVDSSESEKIKITLGFQLNIAPFIKQLLIHANKLYLLSCGIDYMCMSHMMNKGFRYSIMSPYLEDKSLKKTYKFQLIFLTKPYKKLHDFIIQNCNGIKIGRAHV